MKNTIQKLGIFIVMFVLVFSCFVLPASAAQAARSEGSYITGIYDAANLLSDSDESSLLSTMNKYSKKYETDIALVTTSNAKGLSAMQYADNYAESIGMSMSESGPAGILFLIDMDNREIYISTSGQAIQYYSTERIDGILDDCYYKVVDGDYAGSCAQFLQGVRDYMGRPLNKGARMGLIGVLIRFIGSLAGGGAVTKGMVSGQKSRVTVGAANYFNAGGTRMGGQRDQFMRKSVTRRVIHHETNNGGGSSHRPSGGGGGGGIHMSSGGGVHGGGGRKF